MDGKQRAVNRSEFNRRRWHSLRGLCRRRAFDYRGSGGAGVERGPVYIVLTVQVLPISLYKFPILVSQNIVLAGNVVLPT